MERIAEFRNSRDGVMTLVDKGPEGYVVSLYDLDAEVAFDSKVMFKGKREALAYALKCAE